ncbi:MAG: ferredoxin family protein [Candidatus Sericytochromatia bacterium]|nr:ferredoxin family protein [Candidatus Sericytochromatia bacterium]
MTKFVTVDFQRCKGCGLCIEHCPNDLFRPSFEKNERGYNVVQIVDAEFCMGNDCLACIETCPDSALVKPNQSPDKLSSKFYWLGNKLSKNILDRKQNKK